MSALAYARVNQMRTGVQKLTSQDETSERDISMSLTKISIWMLDEHLRDGHYIAEQQTDDTKRVDSIEGNTRSNIDQT